LRNVDFLSKALQPLITRGKTGYVSPAEFLQGQDGEFSQA